MTGRNPPWWMFVLAAAYLAYFVLLFDCAVFRPQPLVLRASFSTAGMLLEEVRSDSAAWRTGLRTGDLVEEADGHRIRTRGDWGVVEANLRFDEPLRLVVRRQDGQLPFEIGVTPESGHFWRTPAGWILLGSRLTQLLTLSVAFLIAFKRPYDVLARLCAWLLASGSVFSIVLPFRIGAVWHDLGLAGALLWIPFASSFAIGGILFTFFTLFPRPLVTRRWLLAAAWIPMAAVVIWFVSRYVPVVYLPQLASGAPRTWSLMIAAAAYGVAGLVALAVNYRRLDDINDRRRLRAIIPGSAAALLTGLVLVIVFWNHSPIDTTGPLYASHAMAVGTLALLALPLSFAYAILWRRMFGFGTLVRQGFRYAFARRGVLLIVPVLLAVLVADLAMQRERSLVDAVAARRTVYVGLIALALYAYWHRERWLAALDRRFFRERYNAQHLLREVIADLRNAGSVDAVAPSVVAHLETAMRPHFAALMFRPRGDPDFRTIASAPAGAAPAPLSSASRIVSLARVLGGPVQLGSGDDDTLIRYLPAEEREVGDGRVDLVAPVTAGPDKSEVLLVLGAKRSEEPYSAEDLDLLSGLAHALALVVERPQPAARPLSFLEECRDCGRCYDAGTSVCAEGHADLVPTGIERVLASRYRLERRLARGGMGAVYEGHDLALERPVAVKLTLEDWTRASGGSDRFRREALIAASFAHPNVVTVYDFGLTRDDRAFLVMERLQGTDLREELCRRGRLTPVRALGILKGVCGAVDAAHRRGLIHRDLKPENLFLTTVEAQEVVKVLDFGLARPMSRAGDERLTRGLLGTPPYMSPEQLRDGPLNPGWDIWALGVVAYELLTGVLPFATDHPAPAAAPCPSSVWPEPIESRLCGNLRPFQRFFARALAVDSRTRPANARDFFFAFEDAARASEGLALSAS
jgi:hypothetical protein